MIFLCSSQYYRISQSQLEAKIRNFPQISCKIQSITKFVKILHNFKKSRRKFEFSKNCDRNSQIPLFAVIFKNQSSKITANYSTKISNHPRPLHPPIFALLSKNFPIRISWNFSNKFLRNNANYSRIDKQTRRHHTIIRISLLINLSTLICRANDTPRSASKQFSILNPSYL